MSQTRFFQQLLERRVIQIVGIYLGAAWVCLEFSEWLVTRYALSSRVTDTVLILLITLLPSVIVVAWNHGAKGPDRWTRLERYFLPFNGIAATLIAVFVLQSAPGLVAAESVTVTDEVGQDQTFLVANEQFRKSVLIYPLERPDLADLEILQTGPQQPDFLAYSLPFLVARDLEQSLFINSGTIYTNNEWGIVSRLQRAGVVGQLDLPLSLQREIAEDSDYGYFITGSVRELQDGDVRIELQLHSSDTAQVLADVVAQGIDIFPLVDRLSNDIYQALELPDAETTGSQDLPIAEITTGSIEALQVFMKGLNRRLFDNDFELAVDNYGQALRIDPEFSLAGMFQGMAVGDAGGIEESRQLLQAAQRSGYRLLETEKTQIKGALYSLNSEPEKVVALYSMWTEIQPQSLDAWLNLANALSWETRDYKLALLTFKQAYGLAPDQTWMLSRMSELAMAIGDQEQALEVLDRLIQIQPDDHTGHAYRGVLLLDLGRLDEAEQDFERVMLMRSDVVTPRISMADLQLRRGNVQAAQSYIIEAEETAASQSQRAIVALAKAELLDTMGQYQGASVAYADAYRIASTYRKPADAIITYLIPSMDLLGRMGAVEEGEQQLRTEVATLQGYQEEVQELGMALLYSANAQPIEASNQLQASSDIKDEFVMRFTADLLAQIKGRIALQQQQYALAAEHFAESIENDNNISNDGSIKVLRIRTLVAQSMRLNGEIQAAEEQLEQVLERFPNYPGALLERAKIRMQNNRIQQAIDDLSSALAVWQQADENFEAANEARALLAEINHQ